MADNENTDEAPREPHILQTKFFYVASIFAVSFGTVSFLWRYKSVNWVIIMFGLLWVAVVTAFAWEIVTRAERLDEKVKARTRALKESNTHLTTLIDQITIFHHLSHRMNQEVKPARICRAFVDGLQEAFPELKTVWLWLDERIVGPVDEERDEEDAPPPLSPVAVAGDTLGHPAELTQPDEYPHMVGKLVFKGNFHHERNLGQLAEREGWEWVEARGLHEFAGYPLEVGETNIGALGLFSEQAISKNFLSHLNLSVNQLAMALEKARLLRGYRTRARDLAEANAELRKLDTMKNWFLSAVSHELRTPLTSIRSFSEILQNYEDLSEQETCEFAGIIQEESDRLSNLINDMLDAASIADGRMEYNPEPTAPDSLIRRSCKLFSYRAENSGLKMEQVVPDGLPRVNADSGKIITVLNNLIGNAIKFTEPGGTIRISAERDGEDGDYVQIAVSDTGKGIGPDDQERIFEKFTRLDKPMGGHPKGVGLGLAICRDIVEKHGGQIWVESESGQGSTFYLTLPVIEGDETDNPGRDSEAAQA